jgi:hypothetical protein
MINDEIKYLYNGNAVYLIEELKDRRFLVANVLLDEYGDETNYICDSSLYIVDNVYDDAPRQVYDKKIVELNDSISKLKDEEESIRYRISSSIEKEKQVLDKLKNFDKLQYLLDFIDGKVTHYVFIRWSTIEIIEYKDSKSEYSHDMKLLSLFGSSKGDIAWRINQYSDGSGCNTEVIPCLSYEMALIESQKVIDNMIGQKEHASLEIIKSAREYGLKLPEGYIEKYRKEWEDQNKASITKLEAQIEEYRNKAYPI